MNRPAVFTRHLKAKILLSIGTSLLLGFGVLLALNIHHGAQELVRQGMGKSTLLAAAVIKSLQHNMVQGRADIARRLVQDLKTIPHVTDLHIYRRDGTIAFQDLETLHQVEARQDRQRDEGTLAALKVIEEGIRTFHPHADRPAWTADPVQIEQVVRTGQPLHFDATIDGQGRYVQLTPLPNEPHCHRCHGADHAVHGVLLVTTSTEPMQADIRRTRLYFALTSVVTVAMMSESHAQACIHHLRQEVVMQHGHGILVIMSVVLFLLSTTSSSASAAAAAAIASFLPPSNVVAEVSPDLYKYDPQRIGIISFVNRSATPDAGMRVANLFFAELAAHQRFELAPPFPFDEEIELAFSRTAQALSLEERSGRLRQFVREWTSRLWPSSSQPPMSDAAPAPDPPRLAKPSAMPLDAVLTGMINRYENRKGTALFVDQPASVWSACWKPFRASPADSCREEFSRGDPGGRLLAIDGEAHQAWETCLVADR